MTGINNDLFQVLSYANLNIPEEVRQLQQAVFKKFNLPFTQIVNNSTHGEFLTDTVKTCTSKYIIFFDVDCIPLTSDIYNIIISELEKEECIIGIEQKCNCNPYDHLYAGPACLAFSTEMYRNLGCPSLIQNIRSDVAEELTWICEDNNIKVKYFNVASSEIPLWHLKDNMQFGIGTTYSYNNINVLYHQFEIRKSAENFKAKCKNILNLNNT